MFCDEVGRGNLPGGRRAAPGPHIQFIVEYQSAADSASYRIAHNFDRTAVDGNCIALAVLAAANARSVLAAGCRDRAAVDGNRAARLAVAAANARAVGAAVRRDGSAVDGNCAAVAADSRLIVAACGGQFAHSAALAGLRVNRQAAPVGDGNARAGFQFRTVAQNQLYVARGRDTVFHRYAAVDDVPRAVRPAVPLRQAGRNRRVIFARFFREVHGLRLRVPLRVLIRHRVRRVCAGCHDERRAQRQEQRQRRLADSFAVHIDVPFQRFQNLYAGFQTLSFPLLNRSLP